MIYWRVSQPHNKRSGSGNRLMKWEVKSKKGLRLNLFLSPRCPSVGVESECWVAHISHWSNKWSVWRKWIDTATCWKITKEGGRRVPAFDSRGTGGLFRILFSSLCKSVTRFPRCGKSQRKINFGFCSIELVECFKSAPSSKTCQTVAKVHLSLRLFCQLKCWHRHCNDQLH